MQLYNQALKKERGPHDLYLSVTPVQKYAIGQRAAENGVTATLHYYAPLQLKETTARRFTSRAAFKGGICSP